MTICVSCGIREVPEHAYNHVCHQCQHEARLRSWETRRNKPKPTTKVCTKCKLEKPVSEFYETRGHLYPSCAECCKEKRKTREYRTDEQARFATTKLEVLAHYGKDSKPVCAVCGESRVLCLTIDHINGGGRKHRAAVTGGSGGSRFYYWLKRNGYPDGYQTLCMNDNFLKLMTIENNSRHKKEW